MSVFSSLIKKYGSCILDGGLATELEKTGHDLNHPLWSGHLLLQDPTAIQKVHESYLKSGAQILLTASYQISFQGAHQLGFQEDAVKELLEKSVSLALKAKQNVVDELSTSILANEILIGASIGAYGAYLANGAEYTGDYSLSMEELVDFHRERYLFLDKSEADFILFETIPSFIEAEAINALVGTQAIKDVAVSFSCRNPHEIRDGTQIESCALIFQNNPKIVALGINCTNPEYCANLVKKLRAAAPDKIIIVYPNSGEQYCVSSKTWSGENHLSEFVKQAILWKESGAVIIGGCCRTGPEHIAGLANVVAVR